MLTERVEGIALPGNDEAIVAELCRRVGQQSVSSATYMVGLAEGNGAIYRTVMTDTTAELHVIAGCLGEYGFVQEFLHPPIQGLHSVFRRW